MRSVGKDVGWQEGQDDIYEPDSNTQMESHEDFRVASETIDDSARPEVNGERVAGYTGAVDVSKCSYLRH